MKILVLIITLFSFNNKVSNTVTYDNKLSSNSVGNLKIYNKQEDKNNNTYSYMINVSNAKGVYKYNLNGKEDYLLFDSNGNASFILDNNSNIIIYDLPSNSRVRVIQSTKYDYKLLVNNKENDRYNGLLNNNLEIIFNNSLIVVEDNPTTIDAYSIIVYILLFNVLLICILRNIKIKRFN